MKKFRGVNVKCHSAYQNSAVLRCDDDYERWYLERFDFSMFTRAEAQKAMEEERPDYYPCIPVLAPGSYEVMYLGESLVKHWFQEFSTE
jgi:hypothetical protein